MKNLSQRSKQYFASLLIMVVLLNSFILEANAIVAEPISVSQQIVEGMQTSQSQQKINDDNFAFGVAYPNSIQPKQFIYELRPGEVVSDYVYLKNHSDVDLKFDLFASDETRSAQGTFALKTQNEEKKLVGKWITFDEPTITLKPGQEKLLKFHVTIPKDQPLGSFSGGISGQKTKPDANNPSVLIAARIGLRVDIKVTDNPQPVPKLKQQVKTAEVNPLYWAYFYVSLALFLISGGIMIYRWLRTKKVDRRR